MPYVSLTIDIALTDLEALEAVLYDCQTSGLEIRDHDVPLMPNVRAPAAEEAIVVAFFSDFELAEVAHNEVNMAFPKARMNLETIAEKDWSTEWRSQIRSVQMGRLWVGPPWEKDHIPKGVVSLIIEPKMAFGTGDHPTTSLCMAAIDAYLSEHPGASMLDVGTGTGVLAFVAHKLGATRVVATDNDPVSVELAIENAQVNSISGVDISLKTLDLIEGSFDLVVANILANTLIDLAPLIAKKVNDRLVLAGVLTNQESEVTDAFVKQGLIPFGSQKQGEWIRIDLRKS